MKLIIENIYSSLDDEFLNIFDENQNKKIFIIKIILKIIIIIYIYKIYKTKIISNKYEKNNNKNHFYKYYNNKEDNFIYFNIIDINFFHSLKFQLVQVEYIIKFYDKNNSLILPSDLALYNDMHIICNIELINSNLFINSLSSIYKNNFFKCIEIFNINEKINLRIIIYEGRDIKNNYQSFIINNSSENEYQLLNQQKVIDYKNPNINFDPFLLNNNYFSLLIKMNRKETNSTLKLKKSYNQYPLSILKRNAIIKENKWDYINIFNNYFCSCKGFNCINIQISGECKYYFYISIIDNNRNIYEKTDYLFIDFIFNQYSSDDVYPIFKEMVNQNMPAHYMTENYEIYKEFCNQKIRCLTIISVNKENFIINGDFIEKYLTLFLQLKKVISGGGIYFNYINNNLFYNIEYISYICVGHGISFFKHFLYSDYSCYGHKVYDKIILPSSKKLIYIAKNYGWNDEDIIKINLPRWDKYIFDNNSLIISNNYVQNKNNSIYIMFTWRDIKRNKNISKNYFKNIYNLLNNDLLNNILNEKNITQYFTLHHRLSKYKYLFKKNKYIKYIEENQISSCLSIISLVISDFSSIIFDLIYRRKPFIIYIPEENDSEIKNNYHKNYYELIESIKNGTINFENKCSDLKDVIDKTINYINNNFKLEPKLEFFYDSFELKPEKTIKKFINILKNS